MSWCYKNQNIYIFYSNCSHSTPLHSQTANGLSTQNCTEPEPAPVRTAPYRAANQSRELISGFAIKTNLFKWRENDPFWSINPHMCHTWPEGQNYWDSVGSEPFKWTHVESRLGPFKRTRGLLAELAPCKAEEEIFVSSLPVCVRSKTNNRPCSEKNLMFAFY